MKVWWSKQKTWFESHRRHAISWGTKLDSRRLRRGLPYLQHRGPYDGVLIA